MSLTQLQNKTALLVLKMMAHLCLSLILVTFFFNSNAIEGSTVASSVVSRIESSTAYINRKRNQLNRNADVENSRFMNDEKRLLDDLLRGYDRDVRPLKNSSNAILIELGITLTQIFDMDEKNQVLTTNVWLDQNWVDEFLQWDPEDYSGLDAIRLPCERIWLPDIVLYNNADDYTRGYMNSKAMVSNTGKVFWPPPTKFRSTCPVDVTYFPFDDQTCRLKLGSWIHNGYQVDVTNNSNEVDLTNYISNGEWELLTAKIVRNVIYYTCCPEPFPDVSITLTIRRKTLYYMYNVVLPCMMMSVLTLLVFCLPPDSGEKIALGVTVLLAFSVFMLAIAEKMPETSESIPLIGIYLTTVMAITSVSIIMTVIVLNCHYRGPIQREVPPWMKKLFVGSEKPPIVKDRKKVLRKKKLKFPEFNFVGRKSKSEVASEDMLHSNTHMQVTASALYNEYSNAFSGDPAKKNEAFSFSVDTILDEQVKECAVPESSSTEDLHNVNNGWKDYCDAKCCTCSNLNSYCSNVGGACSLKTQEEIIRVLKILVSRHEMDENEKRKLTEWRKVAIGVDRVLFWIFFIITTVSSALFLVILPMVK